MLIICFYTVPATTEIYTLSLHDALPIFFGVYNAKFHGSVSTVAKISPSFQRRSVDISRVRLPSSPSHHVPPGARSSAQDRKSTRLNSSHVEISYAVFCLKKKNNYHGCVHPRVECAARSTRSL